ncbi:hypothetical protein HDV02_001475 [Globomyces sp. JEL0801]|nr:hypothetical protein HDV02_001475 [Globomyces sp. JEL0801]
MPLYPELEPYNTFFHEVSEIHSLYVEESGNPNGKPVVFLHGGPGGGTSGLDRRYFNPDLYRIVLFDQRGAGLSTPTACLEENDTWSLVSDIESIRKRLNIDKCVVKGLILRGIFMLRPSELKWFYQEGAHNIFPDYWDGYLAPIPVEERGDLIAAYHKRLTSSDPAIQLEAAKVTIF